METIKVPQFYRKNVRLVYFPIFFLKKRIKMTPYLSGLHLFPSTTAILVPPFTFLLRAAAIA